MRKVKRSLTVIGEFEPFGLQVVGPSGGSDEKRGESRQDGGGGRGQYYLFDADAARVRGGGYEYNAVMGGFWDHDQELYIHDNKVIWSGGQQVQKQFSAPAAVLQAKWCRVEAMNEPLLCILHSDCLMTYTPAGEMHSVPLQCFLGSIWPVPCGLLLQRAAEIPLVSSGPSTPVNESSGSGSKDLARDGHILSTSSRLSPSLHSSSGFSSGRRASLYSATPTTPLSSMFSLLHPLEEPQAVQVEENGNYKPLADMEEQIIWSSLAVPYLVSFHCGRKQHSIWEIKAVPSTGQHSTISKKQSLSQIHTLDGSGTLGLQRVWLEKPGQKQADQVFVASDEDGVPILCLVVKEHKKLSAFRLLRNTISEEPSSKAHLDVAWTLKAISAAPIIALHPRRKEDQHYDLLVLTSDGELRLYVRNLKLKLGMSVYLLLDDGGKASKFL